MCVWSPHRECMVVEEVWEVDSPVLLLFLQLVLGVGWMGGVLGCVATPWWWQETV